MNWSRLALKIHQLSYNCVWKRKKLCWSILLSLDPSSSFCLNMLTVNCPERPSRAVYNNGAFSLVVHLAQLVHWWQSPLWAQQRYYQSQFNAMLFGFAPWPPPVKWRFETTQRDLLCGFELKVGKLRKPYCQVGDKYFWALQAKDYFQLHTNVSST